MHQLHKIWEIPHTSVDSAVAALAELELASQTDTPYTIAILDMHMPEIDGLELYHQIQQVSRLSQTKLIMASSQALRGDALKMTQVGFQGYITKPIQQSELFNILLRVSGLEDPKSFVPRHSSSKYEQFKAHVLVAEDNTTNQLVIEGLLAKLGIIVDLVSDGEEVMTALKNITDYDLIFMDCQMPVLDGYQTTAKIRSNQAGVTRRDIPIIAMTANAMARDKQKCLDSGMDDYLSKPIDSDKVINMLKKWLPDNDEVATESTHIMDKK